MASDLADFFADREALERLAGPLRTVTQENAPATVGDDYEVLGEIARGGMGIVYKARQKSLNRIVALKMVQPGRAGVDGNRFRPEKNGIKEVLLGANGMVAGFAGPTELVLWDTNTGKPVGKPIRAQEGSATSAQGFAFSSDGKTVITWIIPDPDPDLRRDQAWCSAILTIQRWDIATG